MVPSFGFYTWRCKKHLSIPCHLPPQIGVHTIRDCFRQYTFHSTLFQFQYWAKSLVQHSNWAKISQCKGAKINMKLSASDILFNLRFFILLQLMGNWFIDIFYLIPWPSMRWMFMLEVLIILYQMRAIRTWFGKIFQFLISCIMFTLLL